MEKLEILLSLKDRPINQPIQPLKQSSNILYQYFDLIIPIKLDMRLIINRAFR